MAIDSQTEHQNECQQRLQEILDQLRCGPKELDTDLLKPHVDFTRTEIRLVYQHNRIFQVKFNGGAVGMTILLLISLSATLFGLAIAFQGLSEAGEKPSQTIFGEELFESTGQLIINVLVAVASWVPWTLPSWVFVTLGVIFLVVVLLALPVVVHLIGAFLLGRIGMEWTGLALDLNGLYHFGPSGRCFTHWSDIYTVRWGEKEPVRWRRFTPIRLIVAEGGSIRMFVPPKYCMLLRKVIEHLIEYHQPGELLGKSDDHIYKIGNGDNESINSAQFNEAGKEGGPSKVDSSRISS